MHSTIRVATGLFFTFFLCVGVSQASTITLTSGDGSQLARVNTTTAAGNVVGSAGVFGAYAAAFAPNGDLYGILNWATAGNSLGIYDQTTGAITAVGGSFGSSFMLALEIAADGTLYGGSWGTTNNFFTINPTTGAATVQGTLGFDNVMDFAFSPTGTLWAVANNGGATGTDLWTVNLATGVGTFVTSVSGTQGLVMSIMFDQNGTLYATDYISNSHLYAINTGTGVASDLGATGLFFAHGGDIQAAAVPEPQPRDACR